MYMEPQWVPFTGTAQRLGDGAVDHPTVVEPVDHPTVVEPVVIEVVSGDEENSMAETAFVDGIRYFVERIARCVEVVQAYARLLRSHEAGTPAIFAMMEKHNTIRRWSPQSSKMKGESRVRRSSWNCTQT